jgi:nucleoid-associated protein YgaU
MPKTQREAFAKGTEMTGSKLVAMIAAVVAVVGVTAAAVYVYRQPHPVSPSAEGTVATGEIHAPAAEPAKPHGESTSETVVPSFDVVRIEPSGEGVIAGRAEPGWHVSVEDSGSKVAEAIADAEGAWSVVLEKPLPAGEQSLSITAVSPGGARSLISQQSVPVVIANGETTVAAATEPEKSGGPTSPSGAPSETNRVAPTVEPPAPAEAPASQTSEPRAMPAPEAVAPTGLPESSAQAEPSSGPESAAPPPTAEQRKEPMPEAKIEPAAPDQAAPVGPAAVPEVAPAAEAKPGPTLQAVSPQAATSQAASSQPAAAEASKPAAMPRAHGMKHRPRVYTVRHGDTLWAIAERYFGGGWHYVTIYRDNRKQIRNPHRIYPKQKVDLPKN